MPPHNHCPAVLDAQSGRHKFSTGAKIMGGIKFPRRRLIRAAGPDGAESPREILCCGIARTRERENLASLITRHLRDDMRRCTETVNSQAPRILSFAQGAVSDQSRAE